MRFSLLFAVCLDLGLIALRVGFYRPLLSVPHPALIVAEPAIALVAAGLFIIWASRPNIAGRRVLLASGSALGVAGGALLIAHMALENFGSRIGENGGVTLAFMLSAFALWCVAGYRASNASGDWKAGLVAGCWSAMISVLAAVTFGFALMYLSIPPPEYVATWEEFRRSGWRDAQAFSIANSFESAFTHILAGFLLGTILGGLGGVAARARSGKRPAAI